MLELITTGSTLTIDTPFTFVVNVDEDPVTTTVAYPAGVSYLSHTASAGTFDGTTWTVTATANTEYTLSITVTVDDEPAFSAGTRTITATVATLVGEINTGNNVATRLLAGITCMDIEGCVNKVATISTSPHTVDLDAEDVLLVDNSANAVTVNLPAAADWGTTRLTVKVLSDAGVFGVTLEPNGAETIQAIGAAPTANIAAAGTGASYTIVSDGSNLFVI